MQYIYTHLLHNYVIHIYYVYVSLCREEAGKAVTTLCEIAARKKGLNNPIWLGASVLAHFLSGASEPFSQIDPSRAISEIILQFQNPISKEVRERRYSKVAGYVDSILSSCLALFPGALQHESRVHHNINFVLQEEY